MKKALVTGAAGFIGSHLVENLVQRGLSVKALVHYNSRNDWGNLNFLSKDILLEIEILQGNIEDPFMAQKAVKGCDVVFHLAALIAIPYSYIAPESYINTNIKGTLNIMQASLGGNVEKIVHTSTSETYGTAKYTPIDEKHPLQGQSPYSASKIGADKIVESYYLSFDLPAATIRPFNTFGPRQSARAVIPTIITQALTFQDKKIKLGSLTPVRDFCYVQDTVNAFIKIAESNQSIGQVINIGYGRGISIEELSQKIIDIIDPEIKIITEDTRIRPEKSEVMELICDNHKAQALLNWKPNFTLNEGIEATIQFIESHLDLYKPDIYNV